MRLGSHRLHLLVSHGLPESEARVYLALLDHSTVTAGTLAKVTNVPRSHLYTVLQTLHARGLVEVRVEGKTRTYRARPFSQFLRRRASELRTQAEGMEEEIVAAEALRPPPLDAPVEPEAGELHLLFGRGSVAREVENMLDLAVDEVTIASSDRGLPRVLRHLQPHLEPWGRSEKRVDVQVFMPPHADEAGGLEPFHAFPNVRFRKLATSHPLLIVAVDGSAMLTIHPIPDSGHPRAGRDFAFYCTDRTMVQGQLALLRAACEVRFADSPPLVEDEGATGDEGEGLTRS